MAEDTNNIVKFIETYIEADKKYSYKKQYNLNLLDEIDADENAHTRILLKLLSFEHSGTKHFLLEFIKAINTLLPDNVDPIPETDYEIEKQFHNMDGFIYNKQNGYCIIIESKVKEAHDRDKQIERYIKYAHKCGFSKNKIHFVYLTSDGNKQPLPISFTDEAKKILEYENEEKPGRFIQMNNKDHILPFLNNVLEMASFSKENILKTAVVQYINHLEGRFGLRKSEEEYRNVMMQELSEVLGLDEYANEPEKLKKINETQTAVLNMLENLRNKECSHRPELMTKKINSYFNQHKESFPEMKAWIYKEKDLLVAVIEDFKVFGIPYVIDICTRFAENRMAFNFFQRQKKEYCAKLIEELKRHGFDDCDRGYIKYITPIDFEKTKDFIENLLIDLAKLNDSEKNI